MYKPTSRRLSSREARLELAPLLDIIFILLIFFAISTSLVSNKKGINLVLPVAESVADNNKGVVISINKRNQIWLNQKRISLKDIKSKITQLLEETPDLKVILQADRKTDYIQVIRVLDNIRLGGCFDIILEAEKKAYASK